MKIFICDDLGFNYHGGHVALLAFDFAAAVRAFAEGLRWDNGDDYPYRYAVERLADDGRDYTERDWDHPVDGYAPYLIPDDEAFRVFLAKISEKPWRVIDLDEPFITPQVLAYYGGDC